MSIFNKKNFVLMLVLFSFFSFGFFFSMKDVKASGWNDLQPVSCTGISGLGQCRPQMYSDDSYSPGGLISVKLREDQNGLTPTEVKFNGVVSTQGCSEGYCAQTYSGGSNSWIAPSDPGCYRFPITYKWVEGSNIYGPYTTYLIYKVGSVSCGGTAYNAPPFSASLTGASLPAKVWAKERLVPD